MEELTGKAKKATAEAKTEMENQIASLSARMATAQKKLTEMKEKMKDAGAEAWEKVRGEAEKAMAEAKSIWDKVKAKFG